MKKIIGILIIIVLFDSCNNSINSISPEKDLIYSFKKEKSSDLGITSFNEIGKQYFLCKIFGVLFFHQTNHKYSCDELEKYINDVKNKNKKEFDSIIFNLINVNDSGVSAFDSISYSDYAINDSWILDTFYLNPIIRSKLFTILHSYRIGNNESKCCRQLSNGLIIYDDSYSDKKYNFPDSNVRLVGLYSFWNFINYFYACRNFNSEEWDEVLYNSIVLFNEANTSYTYKKAIMLLLSKLDDTHASMKPEMEDEVTGTYVPNFRVVTVDSFYIIKNVRTNSLPSYGLNLGDTVVSLNGVPVKQIGDSIKNICSGSTFEAKQKVVSSNIFCTKKEYNRLGILKDGRLQTYKIKFYDYHTLNNYIAEDVSSFDFKYVIKWLKDSIAYVNMYLLSNNNITKNINGIKKSNGLVLDMRQGINTDVTEKLLNFIVSKNDTCFTEVYPDIKKPGLFRYKKCIIPMRVNPNVYKFDKKIVLLVDESVQGKGEFMIMAMQLNRNVYVIGNTTNGTNGDVIHFYFPGDIEVIMSGVEILYPDFTKTQRKGVKIDERINVHNYSNEDTLMKIALSKF